jgi:hypothetical protein
VRGLCALRRDVIPVIGFDRGASDPSLAATTRPLVLILRSPRGSWGIQIDADGTAVAEEPLDPIASPVDSSLSSFLGTVVRENTAHAVIDPEATWMGLRIGVDEWYAHPLGRETAAPPIPAAPVAG